MDSTTTLVEGMNPVQAAILVSVIDFFLSFVIISGIGIVLALFPYLNRLGKVDDNHLRSGH
jgi:uncharacterized ion transporter superfamily protein YfcC